MDRGQATLISVLLVEDNPVDSTMIRGLLRAPSAGLRCGHVSRLAEALDYLERERPDVVLLDLNLDDSCGYETFRSMREAAPRTAILVLSGSDDEDLAIRTVREGSQDYLVKGSFDGRLLLRAIRYAFERKQSEEALRQSESTVRAIFENSLDGIVITEDRGICMEANTAAAALVGLTREEFIGSSLFKFAVEGLEAEWRGFRESGSGRARFWIRRHDGVKRLVDCSFNANIMPMRHLCVLRDITEQQSLEEQLEIGRAH